MIGSTCRIEETGQIGKIIETYRDEAGQLQPYKVQLDTGQIIEVVNQTITILTLVKKAVDLLEPIAASIGRFFRRLFGRK